jgi:hypothetical protein
MVLYKNIIDLAINGGDMIVPLNLRIRGINFDILAQDRHIKQFLLQLMDQILEKLLLANIKGSYAIFEKNFGPSLKRHFFCIVLRLRGQSYLPPY